MPVLEFKPRNEEESFLDIVHELLLPELKAIRTQLQQTSIHLSENTEALIDEMRQLGERSTNAIQHLSHKLDPSPNIAALEDRIKRN